MKNYSLQRRPEPEENKALWREILAFNKSKYFIVLLLFLLALSGVLIPVIPGLLIFILALALLRKGWMEQIRKRFHFWKIDEHE